MFFWFTPQKNRSILEWQILSNVHFFNQNIANFKEDIRFYRKLEFLANVQSGD